MKLNLSVEVIDAIKEIQEYNEYHDTIAEVEDFLIELYDDDEEYASQLLISLKGLRAVRKLLKKIVTK